MPGSSGRPGSRHWSPTPSAGGHRSGVRWRSALRTLEGRVLAKKIFKRRCLHPLRGQASRLGLHRVSTRCPSMPVSGTMSPAAPPRDRPAQAPKGENLVHAALVDQPPSQTATGSRVVDSAGLDTSDGILPKLSHSSVVTSIWNGPSVPRGAGTSDGSSKRADMSASCSGVRGRPGLARRWRTGSMELVLGGAQLQEQVGQLVVDRMRGLVGPVDLVDHDERAEHWPRPYRARTWSAASGLPGHRR